LIDSQVTIVDYGGNHVQVIQAVYDGECDAGGAYFDVRQDSGIDNVEEEVIIIAETIPMPFLSISFGSALDDQNAQLLRQFIAHMASDEEDLSLMAGLVAGFSPDEANLIEINDYYYNGIKDLIERAGTSADELMQMTE
jgi:ABC-type phosphate/phosphonate transport system substrate-binding protein